MSHELTVDDTTERLPPGHHDLYEASFVRAVLAARLLGTSEQRDRLWNQAQPTTTSPGYSSPTCLEPEQGVQETWKQLEEALGRHQSLFQGEIKRSPTEPFTERDASVEELLLWVAPFLDVSFTNRLVARLRDLIACAEEDFPEQEPMSSLSLNDFFSFLRHTPTVVYPEIVLTYEGNIRAEWDRGRGKHLALEFAGGGKVRFVVFAPDPRRRHETNRASGISGVESVMDLVRPYGVLEWMVGPDRSAA